MPEIQNSMNNIDLDMSFFYIDGIIFFMLFVIKKSIFLRDYGYFVIAWQKYREKMQLP